MRYCACVPHSPSLHTSEHPPVQALLGLLLFPLLALLLGEQRRHIKLKTIAYALLLQAALAMMMLFIPPLRAVLNALSAGVGILQSAADAGAQFMFGFLAGAPSPYAIAHPEANFIVAFRILPLILIVSVLSAVLFHLNILPRLISAFSWLLQRTLGLNGMLGFAAASSVFMGIIEAPVLIKPYLRTMSTSHLFALMTCGMSTVAGTVMVLYASIVEPVIPDALTHILVASVMSVPAALLIAHIMVPSDTDEDSSSHTFTHVSSSQSVIEAGLRGMNEGIKMIVSIAAILIVLFALVHLVNHAFALLPSWDPARPMSLQLLLGQAMRPLVWLIGIPWSETAVAGELMATKTILNEFVAYTQLAALSPEALSPLSRKTMLYAMCGFANLGSLGILSGGLGAIVPERQTEITRHASRAILSGTLTTLMTGSMVHIIFEIQSLL